MQKGSSKVTSKTSLINSSRKKDSDNKSAPCSYWPLAHITRTIIATQIRQTVSIHTVLCLQKDALVEILILSPPQSQLFLFNVYKIKNVQAQRVMRIIITCLWAEIFLITKRYF
jgi:hypothetical protein